MSWHMLVAFLCSRCALSLAVATMGCLQWLGIGMLPISYILAVIIYCMCYRSHFGPMLSQVCFLLTQCLAADFHWLSALLCMPTTRAPPAFTTRLHEKITLPPTRSRWKLHCSDDGFGYVTDGEATVWVRSRMDKVTCIGPQDREFLAFKRGGSAWLEDRLDSHAESVVSLSLGATDHKLELPCCTWGVPADGAHLWVSLPSIHRGM